MERLQHTTFSAQDISSSLLLATYTADADRELLIGVNLSGLAGNGTYSVALTRQLLGAGTAYQSPTSSIALASTVTTAYVPTISIPVQDTDVIKVYAVGLAGDTSVAGSVEVFDVTSDRIAAVLADTNELQGDWADGGRLDLILDARASQTSVDDLPTNTELTTALSDLPTNSELTTALATADDAVLAAIAALNNLSSAGAQAAAAAALAAYDAATGTDVSGLDFPTATEVADAVLSRGAANVEDTAEDGSLTELLLGAFESQVTGTTWTIYKSNHATTFNTRTVTVDENADPITSVT